MTCHSRSLRLKSRISTQALEADQASEKAREKAEAEEAERQRIEEAVIRSQVSLDIYCAINVRANTCCPQAQHLDQTLRVLDLLRLHSLLQEESHPLASTVEQSELDAIRLVTSALIAQEPEYPVPRDSLLSELLRGEGGVSEVPRKLLTKSFDVIPGSSHIYTDSRLFDIASTFLNAQVEEAIEEAEEAVAEEVLQAAVDEQVAELAFEAQNGGISGFVVGAPTGMTMNFIQESEIDNPVSFENDTEWVEKDAEAEPAVTHRIVVEENPDGEVTVTETTEVS